MLGKLIKYEFKATGRILFPLYGALIIFAFINKIFMGDFFNNSDTFLGNLPQVIGILVYVGTMVAIFVVTLFIIIQRYRTNLLCDEGYLMNTLPVKPWNNILSKLIVALVWAMVSGIVAITSILILAYQKGLFSEIITLIPQLFSDISYVAGSQGFLTILVVILNMFIGGISSILMIYASLSIGSLFQKRKILASFAAFIVLNIITNTLASIVQIPVMIKLESTIGNNLDKSPFQAMNIVMVITLITMIVFSIGYFVISNYILSKKLNLE